MPHKPQIDDSPIGLADWDADLEQALATEILHSEKRRVTILAAVLVFLLCLVTALAVVPGVMEARLHETFRRMAWPIAILLVVMIAYELAVRAWLNRLLLSGGHPPHFFRYLNAAIEVSLPTVAIVMTRQALDAMAALNAASPLLYFLFIFLTALLLDFRLCVFAAVVAALEFCSLALWFLHGPANLEGPEMLTAPHQYVVKGVLIILGGLVAGFVATQIKRQFAVSVRTLQERDRAISIFGQHVSPEVAERLLAQSIDFGGETRNVCVMFLDIRDFSVLAAKKSPEEVMEYLNTLFSFMIDVINRHRGIVNKFLGDGFMAVFGAPVDDTEQCHHAINAAIEMIRGVQSRSDAGDIPPTRIGIGLHMGEAVTGNVGSAQRKEYTIIGDVVNLASRIEQATKQFKAQLLVSEAVCNVLDREQHPVEDLGPVELKGQPKPVRLYKIA